MHQAILRFVSLSFVLSAVLSFGRVASASRSLSHELVVQHIDARSIRDFWIGDCDGDGSDDYVSRGIPEEGYTDRLTMFSIAEGKTQSIDQINIPNGTIGAVHVADLNLDGEAEMLIGLSDGRRAWVEAWRPTPTVLLKKSAIIDTPDRNGDGFWDGGIQPWGSADLDSDGIPDLICDVTAGMDEEPRCVVVFSGATWEIIGRYELAGPVGKLKVCERPSSPDVYIILGTTAVKNGNRLGEFTDYDRHLFVLDRECKYLWHRHLSVGQVNLGFECADLDSDGNIEVVLCRESAEGESAEPYCLESIEAGTGNTANCLDLAVQMNDIAVVDLDADREYELIASGTDNVLTVYDKELNIVRRSEPQRGPVSFRWAGDTNGDGTVEIAAGVGSNTLVMFDEELKPMASRSFPTRLGKVVFVRTGRSSGLFLAQSGGQVTMMKLTRNVFGGSSPAWLAYSATLGLLIGGAVGGALVYRRVTAKAAAGKPKFSQARDELVVSLAEFGHSGLARSNLGRLAQYCEALPEKGSPKRPEHEHRLASIMRTYDEFTRGLLTNIDTLTGRWNESEGRHSKLNRHIATLEGLLPRGQDTALLVASALREPERLSSSARIVHDEIVALRRELLASYSTDVPGVICSVVASMRERLAEYGVMNVYTSFEGRGLAEVDEDTLKACMEILLINAAEAMAKSEKREVVIGVGDEGDYVFIDVKDTGCGIEKADWERVFERDASTKGEGHGLGLYHARHTLGRHNASVRVRASSPDHGTTVTIRMRRAGRAACDSESRDR